MTGRPFSDPSTPPTEQALEADFGVTWPFYQKLMGWVTSFSQAWNFSKSGGWMLKVFDRQKALFYLIPLEGGFKLSLAIRGEERETLLQDAELKNIHDKLSVAKKYTEGYALQFEVCNAKDFQMVEIFMPKLIALRK